MNVYSDEKIASSEKVSRFISIQPFYCDYISFWQTFPQIPQVFAGSSVSSGGTIGAPLDLDKSISTLVYQPGSPSVFQFITSQLHYRVEWICRNNSVRDISNKRIHVLIVDVGDEKGYEPWDVKGNRIRIPVPQIGCKTKGFFVLPGNYLFFVLEDTTRSCEFEIQITAFYPRIDYWQVSDDSFCIQDVYCRKIVAYKNSKSSLGRIQRTLNPELEAFLYLFFTNIRKIQAFHVSYHLRFYHLRALEATQCKYKLMKSLDNNLSKDLQEEIYQYFAVPRIAISFRPLIRTLLDLPTVSYHTIYLSTGRYHMSEIVFEGNSEIQEKFYPPPVEPFVATGPKYYCNPQDLALLFYSVNEQNPVKILGGSDSPTPSQDTDDTAAMAMNITLVEPEIGGVPVPTLNYIKFEIEGDGKYFYFDVTSDANIFAFRLNSPIFYTSIDYESPDSADIFRTQYLFQNASVKIEKIFEVKSRTTFLILFRLRRDRMLVLLFRISIQDFQGTFCIRRECSSCQ